MCSATTHRPSAAAADAADAVVGRDAADIEDRSDAQEEASQDAAQLGLHVEAHDLAQKRVVGGDVRGKLHGNGLAS